MVAAVGKTWPLSRLSTRLPAQRERVWWRSETGDAMAAEVTELTLKCFLIGIRERLDKAAAVAKAAEACSHAGNVDQALTIVLDVEQPLYEVTTYLNAASLLNRCCRRS